MSYTCGVFDTVALESFHTLKLMNIVSFPHIPIISQLSLFCDMSGTQLKTLATTKN